MPQHIGNLFLLFPRFGKGKPIGFFSDSTNLNVFMVGNCSDFGVNSECRFLLKLSIFVLGEKLDQSFTVCFGERVSTGRLTQPACRLK